MAPPVPASKISRSTLLVTTRWRAAALAGAVLIAFALVLTVGGDAEPGRRALVIGIDDYHAVLASSGGEAKGPRADWPNLAGAVNDARAITELLTGTFDFDEVRTLLDAAATRQAILDALDQLAKSAARDELIVFAYSGHGSQVKNSKSDEADQLDESIVPADSPLDVPDIRDKELRRRFNAILDRGARLVVLLDNCHSGSGARGYPSGARPKRIPLDPRDVADGEDFGPRPEERGALVLSAAQDDEVAWEIRTRRGSHGAFTWSLLRALRAAAPGESAERVFLRARAWLRSENKYQEPVLAGSPEVRRRPLFGGRAARPDGKRVVAAEERASTDATLTLRGGWADGLDVGSQLVALESAAEPDEARPGSPAVELEVIEVRGLGRSRARVIAGDAARIEVGDLFEIVTWVTPRVEPLAVWIPRHPAPATLLPLARDLRDRAGRGGFGWSEDPVADPPSHVLRHDGKAWHWLAGGESRPLSLGADPAAADVAARLGGKDRLFVHLPLDGAVADELEIGPDTRNSAVVEVGDPSRAAYLLVGRWRDGALEYSWVRPEVGRDGSRSGLPSHSAWQSVDRDEEEGAGFTAFELERDVLGLARVHTWLHLESPIDPEFPYGLRLREEKGRGKTSPLLAGSDAGADDGRLYEGREYTVVLERAEGANGRVGKRYVYVFTIDGSGRCTLLFPLPSLGNVENRLPLDPKSPPRRIELGEAARFRVVPPLGRDTYFLLATAEPLIDPSVLECRGVRPRKEISPLEELLLSVGGQRSAERSAVTSMLWSLERRPFVSLPAVDGRKGRRHR